MEQTTTTPGNRRLRRLTLGFFTGMALLTLFSNTIVNYSLPRVQVKNFESGMMFRQIQADGTIAAQLQHPVNFGAARIVDQVKVEVNSPVLVGDVIATVTPTVGVELLEMQNAL
jgi:multidrug efflux pump subunit AcrA (membrane-fusion protein)